MSKTLNWCLAVASLGASSAAMAVEPRFYQLGDGGAVAPHVKLEFGSDNNPLRSEAGSQESMYFRLSPSVSYLVQQRNNRLKLGYQGDFYQYFEEYCRGNNGLARPGDCIQGSPTYDKASFQDHALTLDGSLEISSRLRATLSATQGIAHQPAGTGQSGSRQQVEDLITPDAWNNQRARVEVSYGAERARGEVRAGLSLTNREFETERGLTETQINNLNSRSVEPDIQLLYRIGTRTQLFARIGSAEVRGKGNSQRDISRQSFGAEFDSSAITSGSIEFSNVTEKFLPPESGFKRRDLEYVGWNAELNWKPRRYSTITLAGGRQTESGLFNDQVGLSTRIEGKWQHFWRERFSTLLEVELEFNEDSDEFSENLGSDENPISFRLEGNYNIRRWLDLGAFIVIDAREGQTLKRERNTETNSFAGGEILENESREFGRTLIGITINGTI